MKLSLRKDKHFWFILFCASGIVAIAAFNLYLLCCGQCVIHDFLKIPPAGWLIMAANLVAGIILVTVKRQHARRLVRDNCTCCNILLRDTWSYCPKCGQTVVH